MASVVFLRGVNVGGRRIFQPAVLARQLEALGAVNVGAAGTLLVMKPVSAARIRQELLRRLPFQPEVMIASAREVLDLFSRAPFPAASLRGGARPFLSVLGKRPRRLPPLPIERPAGPRWEVKVVEVSGRFALSLWRRLGPRLLYPNETVERHLGVPATTRSWSTIAAVCGLLSTARRR